MKLSIILYAFSLPKDVRGLRYYSARVARVLASLNTLLSCLFWFMVGISGIAVLFTVVNAILAGILR